MTCASLFAAFLSDVLPALYSVPDSRSERDHDHHHFPPADAVQRSHARLPGERGLAERKRRLTDGPL